MICLALGLLGTAIWRLSAAGGSGLTAEGDALQATALASNGTVNPPPPNPTVPPTATPGYNVPTDAPLVELTANGQHDPLTLVAGPVSGQASFILTWRSNGSSCTASDGWTGQLVPSGSQAQSQPVGTVTYTLTCLVSGQNVSDQVQVTAVAPTEGIIPTGQPIGITLTANGQSGPTALAVNATPFHLTWAVTGAPDSCTASGAWSGSQPTTGDIQLTKSTGTYTYTLTCVRGTIQGQATINVQVEDAIKVYIWTSTYYRSSSATLYWRVTGAATWCTASGAWSGGVSSTPNTTFSTAVSRPSSSYDGIAAYHIKCGDSVQSAENEVWLYF